MRRHRLDRLQKLAQGAAVISLGVMAGAGTPGCQDKGGITKPEEPIHTNATAQPIPTTSPSPDMTPSMNATAAPMPSASSSASARPHTINAPAKTDPLK